MSEEYTPKLPKYGKVFCAICGEEVKAPPFIDSKPKRGPTTYVHTQCFTEEQKELKEARKR